MDNSTTDDLNRILESGTSENLTEFLEEHADRLLQQEKSFAAYMRKKFCEKDLTQQEIFLTADIPERYGYKLISEEKHTRQRDLILRICLAARFSRKETDTALKLYGMTPLYPKRKRDAAAIIAFNNGYTKPEQLDELLESHGLERLKRCGETE